MKKVLFIITTLRRGGPVNILFDIVKYLDPERVNSHVLTLCPEEGNSRWDEFVAAGATVSCLNVAKGFGYGMAVLRLKGVVDAISPHVVHCIGFRADVLGSLCLGKYRKISSQLNYPFDDYVMTYGKAVGGVMAHLTAWALKRYDVTVACADDVAAKMSARGVPARVIYNAIDDALFVPADVAERKARREQLGISADAGPVFIFVGVLTDRKQPLVTIQAFLRFQAQHPAATLILLGDGPEMAACRALTQDNRRVIYAGRVAETRPYLAASDAYIATSKAEGMPVSVVEALAMRLPVVLSDINPHREILAIDPGAGVLARTGSIDETAAAMTQLSSQDLKIMGDHARRIIELELSARVMSRKFQHIYAELAT
ncbi:glycosyltransferase family 4 protein [Aquincola tertiaricarbonis]|uniref:glycosyltransferase family 4 protein n=1 Tax=Aquincola tertiaricarbonis TaxID=391953 RepID=UPI000614BE18|nr:glycosyltransferase family 4 protein [Aquincola tertiaricarbonis]